MGEFNYEEYQKNTHRMGRTMNIIGLGLLICVPFLFALVLKTSIDMKSVLKGVLKLSLTYLPIAVVEFLIYVPILGQGGSYLSFITGNIINMKLPAFYNAREIAGTEAGSKEDEIISTLSVGVSSLTTMLVIFLGVILLIPLTPVLENPTLKPAFDNLLPALFGALAAEYFFKSWRLTIIPLLLTIVLCVIVPALIKQTTILMIIIGASAIALAFLFYKKGLLKDKEKK